jgi:hypothetical protein
LELLDWHDGVVKQQTAVFGGSVVKGQGDGFMLAFPATGSAAACAAAIQRGLSAGWRGIRVPVRMGMHCGNAKAEGGDFFGRTVVIAARVASAAGGGEILVSQAVQEGLGGAFRLDEARSLTFEGTGRSPRGVPNHLAVGDFWASREWDRQIVSCRECRTPRLQDAWSRRIRRYAPKRALGASQHEGGVDVKRAERSPRAVPGTSRMRVLTNVT